MRCEPTLSGFGRRWFVIAALCVAFASALHGQQSSDGYFSATEQQQLLSFGPWPPDMPPDPGNEFSGQPWAQTLGKHLFHSRLLSGDQSASCASCHQPNRGFTDGLAIARGVEQHVRNTQSLLNVGYQHWFGWDGGADSLWAASLRPILSTVEMNADATTVATRLRRNAYFTNAMFDANIDIAALSDEQLLVIVGKVLAAYQRTLISAPSGFDRYLIALQSGDLQAQQAYPASAKRGLKIFFGEANCHVCHFGPDFSNGEFHDIGRPFFTGVGQVDPGRYTGIKRLQSDRFNLAGIYNGNKLSNETESEYQREIQKTTTVKLEQVNFGQWRTPGLRNLLHTAPYMHDGSLTTLRDVVNHYADLDPARLHTQGEAILKPQKWSEQDREDLVAFLESLTN